MQNSSRGYVIRLKICIKTSGQLVRKRCEIFVCYSFSRATALTGGNGDDLKRNKETEPELHTARRGKAYSILCFYFV